MKVGPTGADRPVSAAAAVGSAGGGCVGSGRGRRARRWRAPRPFLAGEDFGLRLRALLHLLRALFGDDDVALLFDRGLVVDRFQRVRPGLARGLAGAGRIELGAIFERVRQRGIGLAADRDRLVDVLAGIAIGEQRRFRRRAQRLAGPLVVRETRRHGGERDREIGAVAGAHADRAEGAGLRAEIGAGGGAAVVVVAEQIVEEIAAGRARALAYCGPQLFCASAISTERRWFSRSAPPMPPLRSRSRLVVIWSRLPRICWIWLLTGPHCADWPLNSEKKPELSQPMRLACSGDAVEFGLLLGGGFLIAADLLVLGGIAAAGAAVDGRELPFEPDADRIGLRGACCCGAALRGCARRRAGYLREGQRSSMRRCRTARRRSKSSGREKQSAISGISGH